MKSTVTKLMMFREQAKHLDKRHHAVYSASRGFLSGTLKLPAIQFVAVSNVLFPCLEIILEQSPIVQLKS